MVTTYFIIKYFLDYYGPKDRSIFALRQDPKKIKMKKSFLSFTVLFIFSYALFGQTWATKEIGLGIKPVIAVDNNNTSYVAYMKESTSDGFVKMSTVNGDSIKVFDAANGYFYGPIDIFLNGANRAAILYHDHLNEGGDLALVQYNGTTWDIEYITSPGHDGWDGTGVYTNGIYHVISTDGVSGVEYGRKDSNTWKIEVVDSTGAMYQFATDIAVDSQGDVHVVYYLDGKSNLYYAKRANGVWQRELLDSLAVFPSLVLRNDLPIVAYYKGSKTAGAWTSSGTVRLADKTSGTWNLSSVENISDVNTGNMTGARSIVSIALDALNRLHIAFSNNKIVRYGIFQSGAWKMETIRDASNENINLGQQTSMAIGPDGRARVVYYERLSNLVNGKVFHALQAAAVGLPVLDLACAPDTILACGANISPDLLGRPVSSIANAQLSFTDSIFQDCPNDKIIRRQWIAVSESMRDTCFQQITILGPMPLQLNLDTLRLKGVCEDDILKQVPGALNLSCGYRIDSTLTQVDSFICTRLYGSHKYFISDSCRDTSYIVNQLIISDSVRFFNVVSSAVHPDSGTVKGSIQLNVSACMDTINLLWSNGSTDGTISGLNFGNYQVYISNAIGCKDSISFNIPDHSPKANLVCPSDTSINCSVIIDPAILGRPILTLYDSTDFSDNIIQNCPDDILVERSWFAFTNNQVLDTCVQNIKIELDQIEDFNINDTLILKGVCYNDLSTEIFEALKLPCTVGIDSIDIEEVSNSCDLREIRVGWTFVDGCRDTSFKVAQTIIIEDIRLVEFRDTMIAPDNGNNTGSIMLSSICFVEDFKYTWSNGKQGFSIDSLTTGDYSLVVEDFKMCRDTFNFKVGFIDTTNYSIVCPPDTSISCNSAISPDITGIIKVTGYDSTYFNDNQIASCPADTKIARTWHALRKGGTQRDSCVQNITLGNNALSAINFPDTIRMDSICMPEVQSLQNMGIANVDLGCKRSIQLISVVRDSVTCDFASFTRTIAVRDSCRDTLVQFKQIILISRLITNKISNVQLAPSKGPNNGSISFNLVCESSEQMLSWKDGGDSTHRSGLDSGIYVLRISSFDGACVDSIHFDVDFIAPEVFELNCPKDTIISCILETTPANTGLATIKGYTTVVYVDSVANNCPENKIIRRMWIAQIDSTRKDTCIQKITVLSNETYNYNLKDTIRFAGLCIDDAMILKQETFNLACDTRLDSFYVKIDTVDCVQKRAILTRHYHFENTCEDTSFTRTQKIIIDNYRAVALTSIRIIEDFLDTTGGVQLNLGCNYTSLKYKWSNGDTTKNLVDVSKGIYRVNITNQFGCQDSFEYQIPLGDTSKYDSLFTLNVMDRDTTPLVLQSAKFLRKDGSSSSVGLKSQSAGKHQYVLSENLGKIATICINRNDSPLERLSVSDIVRAQRQIVGLSPGCPDDRIAGDVNRNGSVSGADLVLMKNLLLGRNTAYPDSVSWRFLKNNTILEKASLQGTCFELLKDDRQKAKLDIKGVKLGDFRCN